MANKPTLVGKKPKQFPSTATFDPPERFLVQDSPTNPRGALAFFEYWKRIAGTRENPNDRADLVSVKFYLHIPVVNYKLVDPKRTNAVFATVEGPLWFEDPEDFETEVPKRFGAARWHVLLNEAGVHGQLMEAYFGAGSWDDYPLTLDLRTLMRSDPKNAEYIQWLAKNRIPTPWDNPKNEEEEMANDALGVMADQMSRITEKVLDSKDRETEAKIRLMEQEQQAARDQPPPARPQTIDCAVADKGMELLATAANRSIDMVAQHAGSQLNTVEVMRTAAELFRPKGEEAGTTGMFLTAISEMQKSNQDMMRMSMGMRKREDGVWVAPEPPQQKSGGFEEEIMRFQKMAEIFGYQKPGSVIVHPRRDDPPEPQAPPEKSFWGALAENPVAAIGGITTIVTLAANIIYNLMAKGQPVSPQEALVKAQQQTAVPTGNPAMQQQQQQPRLPLTDARAWVGFAQEVCPAFRSHFLDSSLSGYTFAEFILSHGTGGGPNDEGRLAYKSLKENLGIVGFSDLVKMVPPMWEVVKDTPDSFNQFMGEFFGYEEYMEQQAETAAVA